MKEFQYQPAPVQPLRVPFTPLRGETNTTSNLPTEKTVAGKVRKISTNYHKINSSFSNYQFDCILSVSMEKIRLSLLSFPNFRALSSCDLLSRLFSRSPQKLTFCLCFPLFIKIGEQPFKTPSTRTTRRSTAAAAAAAVAEEKEKVEETKHSQQEFKAPVAPRRTFKRTAKNKEESPAPEAQEPSIESTQTEKKDGSLIWNKHASFSSHLTILVFQSLLLRQLSPRKLLLAPLPLRTI